ncbi:hypothetical protein F5I97DRAFT_1965350 [Phlebopus sp. FC_14]|nr:hypothetical protein F5I97DRAFT_1965350 [Phlebopus sp. FC_14]
MSHNYQFCNATPPSLNHTRVPVANGASHRREAPNKAKEPRALFTREPLPEFEQREKKSTSQPQKKRKTKIPDTSPFTYHPRDNRIPLGKRDLPPSRSFSSEGTPPSDSAACRDEAVAATSAAPNRPFVQQDGLEADRKRPRVLVSEPTASYYPYSPDAELNSASTDFRDSPVSYTSSSSPSTSDQSHTRASEVPVLEYFSQLPSPETSSHHFGPTFGYSHCDPYIDPRDQYEAQSCQPRYIEFPYGVDTTFWPHAHQD